MPQSLAGVKAKLSSLEGSEPFVRHGLILLDEFAKDTLRGSGCFARINVGVLPIVSIHLVEVR